MLLMTAILAAVVVVAAIGLAIFKELSWQRMIKYLIQNALPMTDEDVTFQIKRLLAKQQEREAHEKAKRAAAKKAKKELGKKADTVGETFDQPKEVY